MTDENEYYNRFWEERNAHNDTKDALAAMTAERDRLRKLTDFLVDKLP